jgi:hypothetical protein
MHMLFWVWQASNHDRIQTNDDKKKLTYSDRLVQWLCLSCLPIDYIKEGFPDFYLITISKKASGRCLKRWKQFTMQSAKGEQHPRRSNGWTICLTVKIYLPEKIYEIDQEYPQIVENNPVLKPLLCLWTWIQDHFCFIWLGKIIIFFIPALILTPMLRFGAFRTISRFLSDQKIQIWKYNRL